MPLPATLAEAGRLFRAGGAGGGAPAEDRLPAGAAPALPAPAPAPPEPAPAPAPVRAGRFLGAYTDGHRERLAASSWVVLDFETTALTPADPPLKISSGSRVGTVTWAAYRKAHPGASLGCRPRARVLALAGPGWAEAWDLDLLAPGEAQALVRDAVAGKIVVGQNLVFDLAWASRFTDAAPAYVLDSMIVAGILFPRAMARLHMQAAAGDETAKEILRAHSRPAGEQLVGASLEVLAWAVLRERPDKSYQSASSWCVSPLSDGHYSYVMSDVDLPLRIIQALLERRLGPRAAPEAAAEHLRGTPYDLFAQAVPALARMHAAGLPVDSDFAKIIAARHRAAAREAAERLPPGLREHGLARLETGGETREAKAALDAVAEAESGRRLPRTATQEPSTADDALRLAGLESPSVAAWLEITKRLRLAQMADEVRARAEAHPDRRLRALVAPSAVTGRTRSQCPNIQNFPRPDTDPDFRRMFAAPPGRALVACDFSAIEMRIAAALAVRAARELEAAIGDEEARGSAGWLPWDVLEEAVCRGTERAPRPDGGGPEEWGRWCAHELGRLLRRVRREGFALRDGFRRGVDPHLLTAVVLRGRVPPEARPVEWLASLPPEEREALKRAMKADRNMAKVPNFGLLYGMSAQALWRNGVVSYGLSWSEEEAAAIRAAWFEMYPEIELWQLWTQAARVRLSGGGSRRAEMMFFRGGAPLIYQTKLFRVETLSGRRLLAASLNAALNYQDQGSGAEMALAALVELSRRGHRVCNLVHDELLVEVPAAGAEEAAEEIRAVMIDAGDRLLRPWGVPCGAEAAVGETWVKP